MYEKLLYKLTDPIIGKDNREIIELLKDKKDVNEFKLAQKVGLTINQVRNLLYKLYSQNIVSFTRKKDKRKGWYIYFWTLNKHKVLELLRHQAVKELERLNALFKSRENKRFFICKDCGIELAEENALQHNYLCIECGQLLHLKEDKEHVRGIVKEINEVRKEKAIIENELEKLKIEEEIKMKKEKTKIKKKRKKKKVKKEKKKKKKLKKKIKKKLKIKKKKIKKKGKKSKKKKRR